MSDLAVIIEELSTPSGHIVGVVTLNSERTLNSLTLEMTQLLYQALIKWADQSAVIAVFFKGAGEKAFCAGGDVKSICLRVQKNGIADSYARDFFESEYRLDYLIHTYKKPIIVWGSGFVMGGGIGLMTGASHRVVTETSRLAMPEITIGLFPDVGGSYFLSRMPDRLGLFLGMTGVHLNASDALYTGLANFSAQAQARDVLLSDLVNLHWSSRISEHYQQVSELLESQAQPELPSSQIAPRITEINARAGSDDLNEVVHSLTAPTDDPWFAKAGQALAKGSPTSAGLILRQWQNGRDMSLAEVFRVELTLAVQCAKHPDFIEGVRALLVDKDNNPNWQPKETAHVTQAWLDEHYVEPWQGPHPLADLA